MFKIVGYLAAALLIALSLFAVRYSDKFSPTALIPGVEGILLAVFISLAIFTKRHKLWMHVALGVVLLFLIAGIGRLASSGFDLSAFAGQMVAIMSAINIAFLILAIRSFLHARRKPKA
ncbi:MAG: hypothetical protein AAF555_01190 [Verrucomicrobiota bacterium]